jgi:hypothetical protein
LIWKSIEENTASVVIYECQPQTNGFLVSQSQFSLHVFALNIAYYYNSGRLFYWIAEKAKDRVENREQVDYRIWESIQRYGQREVSS